MPAGQAADEPETGGIASGDALREGELVIVGRIPTASNATLVCDATPSTGGSVRCVYKPIRGEVPLWDFPDGTLAGPNVMPVWHGAGAGHGPGLILAGYDQPVACGGAAVHPGDIVVGDADGVLAIPAEITEEVALEAVDQQRLDLWLQREVDSGRPLSGLLPPDAETLERYRTETGQA